MEEYKIWLSHLKISNKEKLQLLNNFKDLKLLWDSSKIDLEKMNIPKKVIIEILNMENRKNIEIEKIYMNKHAIKIISCIESAYPTNLKNISNKPALLYVQGNIDIMQNNCIAVIGSREPSDYGKRVAKSISKDLSDLGITVVSGLAKGIDSCSHIGALDGKSKKTIAVLGNGLKLENLYPKENLKLYEKILENDGVIVSEYCLNEKAEKYHFPERNRIISGISEKVLVVEAALNSGTFITVDFALEQGKDVYAIPGGIYAKQSLGCNKLIKEGAGVVLNTKDLLE